MNRGEALRELLAKVEAGNVQDWRCFILGLGLHPDDRTKYAGLAYNGSLDAAEALHKAVLPCAVIWDQSHSYFGYEFSILVGDEQFDGCSKDTPARAWLIAIIKALIAQEGDQ